MTTTMIITCMHCGHIIGTKDGKGQTGPTSGICNACLWTHYPKYAPGIMAERYAEPVKEEMREAA